MLTDHPTLVTAIPCLPHPRNDGLNLPLLYDDNCNDDGKNANSLMMKAKVNFLHEQHEVRSHISGGGWMQKRVRQSRVLGIAIGFMVQLINVVGTTYLYIRWGGGGGGGDGERYDAASPAIFYPDYDHGIGRYGDTLLYVFVWITAKAETFLYFLLWLSLSALLTKPGIKFAQSRLIVTTPATPIISLSLDGDVGGSSGRDQNSHNTQQIQMIPSRRSVFVMGVNFYVGVVIGVFLAWVSVDAILGLPLPIYPMIGVLLFGLGISYCMILYYDSEDYPKDHHIDDDGDYHDDESDFEN